MSYKLLSEPFTPPDISSFLQEPYWAINEAVHVLVGWPKNNLFATPLSVPSEELSRQRPFFYLPGTNSQFDPKAYGREFLYIFLQMKSAIESGSLNTIFGYSSNCVSYLVIPEEIILWALHKGILLPQNLQVAAKVHQIREHKTTDRTMTKIQRKIAAQFILSKHPDIDLPDICRDDLMLLLGALDRTKDAELKAVKRAIGGLFSTPGLLGRPPQDPQNKKKRLYIPAAIQEVMQRDQNGIPHYHFPYLKRVIQTALRAKIHILGQNRIEKESFASLFKEFLNDSIVSLYLADASDLLMKFIHKTFLDTLADELFPQFRMLVEKSIQLEAKGVIIEWPLKHGDCEFKMTSVKKCLL